MITLLGLARHAKVACLLAVSVCLGCGGCGKTDGKTGNGPIKTGNHTTNGNDSKYNHWTLHKNPSTGEAIVAPPDGILWRAWRCTNTGSCPGPKRADGHPFLFAFENPELKVEDGEIVYPEGYESPQPMCPACFMPDVKHYVPDETASLILKLEAEKVLWRAEQKKPPKERRKDLRTPREIDKELTKLPTIYLKEVK